VPLVFRKRESIQVRHRPNVCKRRYTWLSCMALDVKLLANKLRRYREQLAVSITELEQSTGIERNRLARFEAAEATPTGDEILILADFFRCDYKFFISNERTAPFEETETLYRRFGDQFSKEDRRSVQDFLFLCECEARNHVHLFRD
jgi:transcriptional regulator with XRE-family HTH domain